MPETRMTPTGSAAASIAINKALQDAYNENRPDPSAAELMKIAAEADRKNVFGVDYKLDRNGSPIQQGISNNSVNHWTALKKREQQGLERPGTYDRMVRELFKKDPEAARRLGLQEPQRAGA